MTSSPSRVSAFGRGNDADGSFRRRGLAFDPLEHPLQDAHIFAVARPQKFSVGALAEPIHVENFRRMGNAAAHFQPVPEIIAPCCIRRREAWPSGRAA